MLVDGGEGGERVVRSGVAEEVHDDELVAGRGVESVEALEGESSLGEVGRGGLVRFWGAGRGDCV